MSLWPGLPIELKRLILELIALDDVNHARSLRLVSRDINVLVLPIIFNSIVIENVNDFNAVTRTILPPPSLLNYRLKKKKPDIPRILSTYNTTSLALLLRESLPSIENALASIGPVFSRIRYLAITSRNLSSNAFWLRENNVHPTRIMLLHHGSPRPVNWRDSIFNQITHIYTSSLDSHGRSTLSDLSNLTHIATSTHAELSDDKIRYISQKLEWLLDPDVFPQLQALVLALERFPRPPQRPPCGHLIIDLTARERYNNLLTRWRTHLQHCLSSSKFYILPDPHSPYTEWQNWIHTNSTDIWIKAISYREKHPNSTILNPQEPELKHYLDQWLNIFQIDLLQSDISSHSTPVSKKCHIRRLTKIDWEIDLVQREGYRESERLDPGEAGEFEHVLGF